MKLVNSLYWPDSEEHLVPFGLEYQKSIRNKAIEVIPEGLRTLAIDIGAHVGIASIHFSKYFQRVISFEPIEETYSCLCSNTSSIPNILKYPIPLSSSDHYVDFSRPNKLNTGNTVPSSSGFGTYYTKTLDSFNLDPTLIKIDVEGFELRVLEGAKETILRSKPIIIVEVKGIGELKSNPLAPILFLEGLGYVPYVKESHDYIMVPKEYVFYTSTIPMTNTDKVKTFNLQL